MFPIRDDNPQLRRPYVTYALIAANIACWLLVQGAGFGATLQSSICEFGVIPVDLLGGIPPPISETMCPIDGQPNTFTLISTMFMHGGWGHLLGNMWFLWIFGDNVEDSMGHVRFAIFYILGGIGATAAQVLAGPASAIPMVGASGAIGAVMGAYIMLYPKVRVHLFFFITTFQVPAFLALLYWFGVQFVGNFFEGGDEGGKAFWAHIGGFISGAVLVHIFKSKRLLEEHPFYGWQKEAHAGAVGAHRGSTAVPTNIDR